MDKRTVFAIVGAVIVITVGFFIQSRVAKNNQPQIEETRQERPAEQEAVREEQIEVAREDGFVFKRSSVEPARTERELEEEEIVEETDLYRITFSTEGGTIKSLKLREHTEKNGTLVDMIFRGESEMDAFELHFGGPEVEPVDDLFAYDKVGRDTFVFSRDFRAPSEDPGAEGEIFTLTKRYVFKPGEYLFELHVEIDNSVNAYPNLDEGGYSYTLSIGPQIGPEFEELDGRRAFRNYTYYDGERSRKMRLRDQMTYVEGSTRWQGIVGKYFSVIAVPDAVNYDIAFAQVPVPGVPAGSQMFISRPRIKSAESVDTFRIYAGPNLKSTMARYDDAAKNAFGVRDLDLGKATRRSVLLGWLETILRWILQACYRLIPNYGVAIILLTIIIKLALFPITRKSYDSTSKMQALNPKIQEIREKYKDNPQKMNQETQALYKKEGVSPLGGCLPLMLQMPFFIALYGLLNNHFALRGATFIPGWIDDLSAPEYIWHHGASIPIIGEYLRLLPIIFVATQLISSRFMQTPSTGSQGQMKIMTYAMPIVFFFILYDAPSGLILYWTITNLLTVIQQYVVTKVRAKKAEA